MRPLENRPWFVLLTLSLSTALMAAWWLAAALPFTMPAGGPLLLAMLGLWMPVRFGLALLLIRREPASGGIG